MLILHVLGNSTRREKVVHVKMSAAAVVIPAAVAAAEAATTSLPRINKQ
jgi:hypothetical protein